MTGGFFSSRPVTAPCPAITAALRNAAIEKLPAKPPRPKPEAAEERGKRRVAGE